jgi:hypothetical protein
MARRLPAGGHRGVLRPTKNPGRRLRQVGRFFRIACPIRGARAKLSPGGETSQSGRRLGAGSLGGVVSTVLLSFAAPPFVALILIQGRGLVYQPGQSFPRLSEPLFLQKGLPVPQRLKSGVVKRFFNRGNDPYSTAKDIRVLRPSRPKTLPSKERPTQEILQFAPQEFLSTPRRRDGIRKTAPNPQGHRAGRFVRAPECFPPQGKEA